jgi:uncharacterized protein YcnI
VILSPRTWRRATLGALAATVLLALPAGAHPFVRGGEVPVDSVATLALAMGHGCGTEDRGGGEPTTEIALEVPDVMRVVEVADDPSYEYELEADADGRVQVVTWTAIDVGEPAPDVEFEAVLTGAVGDEIHLRVFQGCDGFAYRWIGTPDEPADDPAVRVTLVEADADAPATAEGEPTPAELEATGAGADTAGDDPVAEDDADAGATDGSEEGDEADEAGTEQPEPVVAPEEVEEEAVAEDEVTALDAEEAADEAPGIPWPALVVVALALAGLGIALARRSRGPHGPEASGPGTGTGPDAGPEAGPGAGASGTSPS